MSSAEPPAGRRPEDDGAPADTPPAGRPISRNDLFGPGGPFKMSGTPAAPRGASSGPSGFEPPEGRAARPAAGGDEPTRVVPAEPPHPRDAADLPDDRTEVYRPDTQAAERTQVYPQADYRPGQYQPRSMGPNAQGKFQQSPYQAGQYQPGEYQPGQYQPGQYQPRETLGYPGDGDDRGSWYGQDGTPPGPDGGGRRSWVVAGVVALLVLVAGAAGAYALFGPDDGTDTASQTGASTSPTTAPSAEAEETAEPQESETEEPTGTEEPATAYEPVPAEPWTDKSLDFGYLTNVVRSGDEVRLSFNRASFFVGDEATEKNGGTPPDNDYFIEDTNQRVRTFTLLEGAALQGSALLGGDGGDSDLTEITVDELIENAGRTLDSGIEGIPVWLRHERGRESDVTALAEQFIP
jgi:hypothetical protein